MVETIEWTPAGVRMLDQTRLPHEVTFVTCGSHEEVADAIKRLVIRGAPAIGVAAAMGVALGFQNHANFQQICDNLERTRPTAVNLKWALDRMKAVHETVRNLPFETIRDRLI